MNRNGWVIALACALLLILGGAAEDAWDTEALSGVWRDEDGLAVMQISPDGDYTLQSAGSVIEGYLVLADESDGIWDGIRYVLYGTDEQPLPDDLCLLMDAEYPDEMVLSYGETAQLFLRDGAFTSGGETIGESAGDAGTTMIGGNSAPQQEGDVQVQWLDESGIDPDACDHFAADTSAWAVDVAFTVPAAVRDFKVLALSFDGMDDQGRFLFSAEELYVQAELTPDRPLAVAMAFYGDIPNNGIAYTDADGQIRLFSVEMSGEDGSLYLSGIGE